MPKIQILKDEEKIMLPVKRNITFFPYLPWVLLAVVILVGAGFIYRAQSEGKKLQQQLTDLKQNPQKATQQETQALLDKVGQLVELPSEQPTVATVTDLTPLKDQPFFAHAQIGDKVLIYSSAKKAILYRPSTNKVIEIAPVNLDNPPTSVNINGKINTTTNANTKTSTNAKATTNTDIDTNTNVSTGTNTKIK